MLISHCRNAIHISINSATADTFNLEYVYNVEYIPTVRNKPWVDSVTLRASEAETKLLNEIVSV